MDNEEHRRFLAQLDARETFGPLDFVRKQYGCEIWMRTIGKPQFCVDGMFKGYIGIAFDVTQEILATQALGVEQRGRSMCPAPAK